jgi:hypothetical protein
MELAKLKKEEPFSLYGRLMDELLARKLIRTSNNPVSYYGEYIEKKNEKNGTVLQKGQSG